MVAAALPDNEHERLAALIALGILGTDHTTEFDIYPSLVSKAFSAPIAAISLVDQDRQWFKASVGLDVTETPRDSSFCAHAILNPDEVLYVPDATKDDRFADNPLVVGEFGLRFYAGKPIIGPSGHAVGAICVMDREPREVGPAALEQLRQLAIGVGSALKLHASIRELRELSVKDALTGLENRAGFNQHLRRAMLHHAANPASAIGLLFLDLDRFKQINDSFGHDGGDAALQEVAARLREVTRSRDAVSRFGGDEFCIMVEGLQDELGLQVLAERIHERLAEPFVIDREVVPLATSIGVSVGSREETDPEALVRSADRALYEAKRAGRGVTRFARAEPVQGTPSLPGRGTAPDQLRAAMVPPGQEPFALRVQPISRGRTLRLVGFEVFASWTSPDGAELSPAGLAALAGSAGLAAEFNRWVLDRTCAFAARLPELLTVSTQLAAAGVAAEGVVDDVREALRRHGLLPRRLKLQFSEDVLLLEPARAREVVQDLREIGVQTVLDQFGAGQASLASLRDYAFTGLRVCRDLVATTEADDRGRAFVRAIVELASTLRMEVTADGVQTTDQLRFLRRVKIDAVQGPLVGPLIMPAAVPGLLLAHGIR